MLTILTIVICFGMIVGAILAVSFESVTSSVISAGLTGLFASVTYVILAAPDVAMTEAAIGSGLTTVIFLYTIKKTKTLSKEKKA